MRVRVVRAADDYELNVRHTNEIAEQKGMSDEETDAMEEELRKTGRWWLDAETILVPVRAT